MRLNRFTHGDSGFAAPKFVAVATLIASAVTTFPVAAADTNESEDLNQQSQALVRDVMALKKEALALDRDLYLLDHQIRFPERTRVTFFLRLEDRRFNAQSISLLIDNVPVITRNVSVDESALLRNGGSLRVSMANTAPGERQLQIAVNGQTLNRSSEPTEAAVVSAEATLNKGDAPLTVEMALDRKRRWIFQRYWVVNTKTWEER